ncbi:DNA repair protein RecN [Trueperella bernardiae]|uniref:DNA repair protein RecN n=1 Tax=Trueperella bernardiae TaxID=59561 RepID=UPI00294952F3|nr:DNA repair protein RecN [Trueperella bernardiae]MDV6238036.1 DNA repair protein RecN [Trueperella bernardiae]
MIDELRISNLGVIESAHVDLSRGMTAITGETGAGKTMALTSLGLLMGAKAEPHRVRQGATAASVEATFVVRADSPVVELVENAGGVVDVEGDEAAVILARHVPAKGRSRAYAGGQSVPVKLLEQIAEYLITVHGQADQLKLRSEAQQRHALDAFGGQKLAAARAGYEAAWAASRESEELLADFKADMRQAAAERLALEALVKRVDAVEPRAGEEDELKARALVLENVEDLRSAMAGSIAALSGSDDAGALGAIDAAAELLAQVRDADAELGALSDQLREVSLLASDVTNALGVKLSGLDADPEELDSIHARRAELRSLQRDLGMTVEEILAERGAADAKLAQLAAPEEHLAQLEEQVRAAHKTLMDAGRKLRATRRTAGEKLGAMVTAELHDLAMKDATFSVAVEPREEPARHGIDSVSFLLRAHRGAPDLPLSVAASGGEVSRIMLALEVTVNADPRPDHTFIFDEVDAGIGGKTALSVGERLAKVGRASQVLTVTHLAQVAAYANHHVVVAKKSEGVTTSTDVVVVEGEERVSELARMLSGHAESEVARTHAAELISGAVVS